MDIVGYHSISDLYSTLGMSTEQEIEFAILSIPDIHPQIPFSSPRLRADYFSFIITKEGSGIYYLDENRFPFSSNTLYFTNPGHIKSYELHESNEAYIITATESYLRENVHVEIFGEFPFLLAEIVPPKKLSDVDFEEFEALYKQMLREYHTDSEYRGKILGNLFTVMLLKIKEKLWSDYNPIEEGSRNSQIVKSFKQLLETEFRNLLEGDQVHRLQVNYFAERMNLHPNYLNSVIKSKTGRTVNDWISSRILSIAKSLLVSTPLSLKEIAYKLGFSEPTHFSRFFKKQTQLSPSSYRGSNRL